MTTTTIVPNSDSSSGTRTFVLLGSSAVAGAMPSGYSRSIAPVLAGDQGYYWTRAWQAGERESLRDLGEGESRRFENGLDAIRWLLDDEDCD